MLKEHNYTPTRLHLPSFLQALRNNSCFHARTHAQWVETFLYCANSGIFLQMSQQKNLNFDVEADLDLTPYKGWLSIKQMNHGVWMFPIQMLFYCIKYYKFWQSYKIFGHFYACPQEPLFVMKESAIILGPILEIGLIQI